MSIPLATLHPNTLAFDTEVTASYPDHTVELAQTYFYATSGGQPNDTGVIIKDGDTYSVIDVFKRDGRVTHRLDRAGLQAGDRVHAAVDAARRSRLRRIHTATHVLCAVLERSEGTKITGNQLGPERARVDFDMPDFDQEKLQRYIAQANAIIAQGVPVRRRVTTREELLQNPQLVKLAAGFPEHIHEVHIVEIEGVDVQPCGGTHVDTTAEIGQIAFLKAENRGKSNRRVYFTLAS